MTEFELPNHTA